MGRGVHFVLKTITGITIAAVAVCVALGLVLYARSDPSTATLDGDIATVREHIQHTDIEIRKYEGGFIRTMIELRREVLKTTEAMLEQKRSSLIRRIDLRYVTAGAAVEPSQEKLDQLTADIAAAKAKLEADEVKAAEYSGGLVQAFSLMTVETDRLALAQLHLAYYAAKYGISLELKLLSPGTEGKKETKPGVVVKDKDAF